MAKKKFGTFNDANDIGTLNGTKSIKGTITRADKIDFFELDLSGRSSFSLEPQTVKSNLKIDFFGGDRARLGKTKFKAKGKKKSLERDELDAGTYYIKVTGKTKAGKDKFKLRLESTLLPSVTETTNPGVVSGAYTNTDSVGVDNPLDLYNFQLTEDSTFEAQLSGLSLTVGLELFNDINANGIADGGEAIAFTPGTPIDLDAGSYIIRVNGGAISSNTGYTLTLEQTAIPTDDGDNTLGTATDLGVVTTTTIRNSSIGADDEVDFYKFTLNDIANLDVRTEGDSVRSFQLIGSPGFLV